MSDLAAYGALFGAAFLAATILPALSEPGLAGLIVSGEHNLAALIVAAGAGNTLGAVVNWVLGRYIEKLHDRKWFPATPGQIGRASAWYRKYGRWSLLLSWAPVIGDPLTLAAGVLREPFWSFLLLVAAAKTLRYLIVAAVALNLV